MKEETAQEVSAGKGLLNQETLAEKKNSTSVFSNSENITFFFSDIFSLQKTSELKLANLLRNTKSFSEVER